MYFYYIIQFSLRRQATDSSFCRIALLGFAIRMGTLVNMKEGENQSFHLKARVMVRGEGIIVLL